MEEQTVDQLQLAADAIAENLPSLRRELRAKTEAMRKMEEELAELRGQVPRLMGEAEGLRQELREAVQERDALTIKLASTEKTNLEQKRALENLLMKVEIPGLALPSTSSISIKTTKQGTDAGSAELPDSKNSKSPPSSSDDEPMDLSTLISQQTSQNATPGNQITSGTVEPSAPDLPLASQSTAKPRALARTKSTQKKRQSKTPKNGLGEEGAANRSRASAGSSSSLKHGPQCLCGKPYKSTKSLQQHIDYVSGKFSKLCDICGERFGSATNLKAHKKFHHPNATTEEKAKGPPSLRIEPMMTGEEGMFAVGCPECPATFNNDEELTTHVMEVHRKGEK